MTCLIVEDEKIAAERLVKLVHDYDASIEILTVTQSVSNTIEWLKKHAEPDIALMDIQLSDGLSFEIFEQFDVKFPVIFTTAFDEYALKAFKLNSIDYLLKPISAGDLKAAMDKYKSQNEKITYPIHMFESLLKGFTQQYKSKFVIKVGDRIRVIPVIDVQCFYSMEKAVFLQTRQGRDYAVNYTLDQLEELLDPAKFFRINRAYVVAFEAIKDILAYSNSRLIIHLVKDVGSELIVSRERVQNFRKWLED